MDRFRICFVPITGTLEFILIIGFEKRTLRLSKEEFEYFIKDCYKNIKNNKEIIETNKYQIENGKIYVYTKHILNNDTKTLDAILQFYKENQVKITLSPLEEIESIIKDMIK